MLHYFHKLLVQSVNYKMVKKFVVTFRPKDSKKGRFIHREFDTKKEANKRLKNILKKDSGKRFIQNPRVSKNPFFKK